MAPLSPGWSAEVKKRQQAGGYPSVDWLGALGLRPTPEFARQNPWYPVSPATARPGPGLASDPRIHNAPTTEADLAALREGQNAAIRAYGPGQGAPDPHVVPPERARREAVTAMAQQYAPQSYWESETGKAMAAAAQSAGEAALAARKSGPLADVADTSNPASQAYWDRADIQAWAGANKGLAASLRRKHGLPEDFTARIPTVQPAGEFAYTPEQRAAAEAGYAGVTVDPSAAAGMGAVNSSAFSKSDVFNAPQYSVSDQALAAPAAPGTAAAQMNFSEPYLNPNEIRDVNLSGNDALQRAASGQAAKTGSTLLATSEAQRQVAESGYGGVKDPLLTRYLGMARVQNTSFPR